MNWFKRASLLMLAFVLAPVVAAISQTAVIGIPSVFQSITIGSTTLHSAPRMTWYSHFIGSFGGTVVTSIGSTWQPTSTVLMTRFDVSLGTAWVGCTTNPQIGVYDATTAVWLYQTALSGSFFAFRNAVSSIVLPAGHNITLGVETADAGCTTQPGDAQITVEYIMQ